MRMLLQLVGTGMFRRVAPDLATLSERVRLDRVGVAGFGDDDAYRLVLRLVGLAVLVAQAVALERK